MIIYRLALTHDDLTETVPNVLIVSYILRILLTFTDLLLIFYNSNGNQILLSFALGSAEPTPILPQNRIPAELASNKACI